MSTGAEQDPDYIELARLSKSEPRSHRWRKLIRRLHLQGWTAHDLARCAGIAEAEMAGYCSEEDG